MATNSFMASGSNKDNQCLGLPSILTGRGMMSNGRRGGELAAGLSQARCLLWTSGHKPEAQAKDRPSLALQACVRTVGAASTIDADVNNELAVQEVQPVQADWYDGTVRQTGGYLQGEPLQLHR